MIEASLTKETTPNSHDQILLILRTLERTGQQETLYSVFSSLCSLFQVGNYLYRPDGRPKVGTVMYADPGSNYGELSGLNRDLKLMEIRGLIKREGWDSLPLDSLKLELANEGREHAQQLATQYPQSTEDIETRIRGLAQEENFAQAVFTTAYKAYINRL